MKWRLGVCGILSASALAGAPPVDSALLEFLGSVDSNQPGWHAYLASADPQKVARVPARPALTPPTPPTTTPSTPASPAPTPAVPVNAPPSSKGNNT